jgi:hypothetical protein
VNVSLIEELTNFIDWEGSVEWIEPPDAPSRLHALGLPEHWVRALSASGAIADRIPMLWGELRTLLPRTFEVFTSRCNALLLLRTAQSAPSLVYVFAYEGWFSARRGFLPVELPAIAQRFSTDLTPFYRVHDGLTHLLSHDGGPAPVSEWKTLLDPDSEQPSLVRIATNGPDAFGFDVSEAPSIAYSLQPHEDAVSVVAAPWDFIDDLIASPLE